MLLTAGFCLCRPVAVFAHDPGLSSLELRVTPAWIAASLSLSAADTRIVLKTGADGVDALALDAIDLRIDGVRLRAVIESRSVDNDTGTIIRLNFIRVRGSRLAVYSRVPGRLALGHRELLTIRGPNRQVLVERMLDAHDDEIGVDLDLGTRTDSIAAEFFALGIRHILSGYDHLLFLGALLLGVRRLGDVVKTVTAFTVAHSITLLLAVLGFIRAPAVIVEPLIAASIVYVGLENLVRHPVDSRWKLTFVFGLIHGFGFAGALQELGIGTHGTGVAVPLGSFNVGVEAGQIAVAMALWPLLRLLNSQPAMRARLSPVCSMLVAGAGTYWLAARTLF